MVVRFREGEQTSLSEMFESLVDVELKYHRLNAPPGDHPRGNETSPAPQHSLKA